MISEFNGDFLQWLRGFYYVAKTGSISKAARKMNRSQSSISYQIQSLEKQLNVQLFTRLNSALEITPQGVRLLDWAISAFELIRELEYTIGSDPNELTGNVGISGSMTLLGREDVSDRIADFMRTHPKVQVRVRACRPLEAITDIEEGISDYGLLAITRKPDRLIATRLYAAPFILVAPRNHSFVIDKAPTREQLQELPFVTYVGNTQEEVHTPWLTCEQLVGLTGTTVATANQYQLVLDYISRGIGCAIMDMLSLQIYPNYARKFSHYSLRHFLGDLQYSMLSRKHRAHSPAASILGRELLSLFQNDPSPD